ncbi:MAG: hypothetical protein WCK59_04520 [Candidatus Falkowbacteria bacterium]
MATETFQHFKPDLVMENLQPIGVATPETEVQVYEIISDANVFQMFYDLPGTWAQKVLSQNQVIEFCEQFRDALTRSTYIRAQFLCKKNEYKPIIESNPKDNLVVIYVSIGSEDLSMSPTRLGNKFIYRTTGADNIIIVPAV